MPVLINYAEHELFRDSFQRGYEQGFQRGFEQGQVKGARKVLSQVLEQRFGPLPRWATVRVADASIDEIDAWLTRMLNGPALDRVFAP